MLLKNKNLVKKSIISRIPQCNLQSDLKANEKRGESNLISFALDNSYHSSEAIGEKAQKSILPQL